MKKTRAIIVVIWRVLVLTLILCVAAVSIRTAEAADSREWKDKFDYSSCVWSSSGKSNYFIVEPGYQQTLEGEEEGEFVRLVITVLNETRKIGNVETRVVEERETHNGELEEVSRNYFAICGPSNDVYYFGEAVDVYENGKIDHHEGEWIAESNGAKAGLFITAQPKVGERFYQEIAPKVAMDRVETVSITETLKTPAGEFHDCVKTEETTPLERGVKEYKIYAKGIGIAQDGSLLLVKYETNSPK